MKALERNDSPNPAVRAIERWKRGATVAILAILGCAPGLFAAMLAALAAELLGASGWRSVTALIAFLLFAPWGLGQRFVIRQIGKLAAVADD